MVLVTLTGFANYENRTVKYYNDFSQYISNASSFREFPNINFKINDGITTEQIINVPIGTTSFRPDYLLVTELVEGFNQIVSRWYVIEATETRALQYNLTLQRDIIADNYSKVLTSPAKILRGWCSILDSAIFNPENMSVNQIKKDEILLKDETGCAWVVGYMSDLPTSQQSTVTVQNNYYAIDEPEELTHLFRNHSDYGITFGGFKNQYSWDVKVWYGIDSRTDMYRIYTVGSNNVGVNDFETEYPVTRKYYQPEFLTPTQQRNFAASIQSYRTDIIDAYFKDPDILLPKYADFVKYQGKVIRDANNNYYKIKTRRDIQPFDEDVKEENAAPVLEQLANENPGIVFTNSAPGVHRNYVEVHAEEELVYLIKEPVREGNVSVTIPSSAYRLNDRPYYMFCMPMDAIAVKFWDNQNYVTFTTESLSYTSVVDIGAALSKSLGTKCMDIQLLPYCPCLDRWRDSMLDLSLGDISGSEKDKGYVMIKEGEFVRNVLVFCKTSSLSTTITHSIPTTTNTLEKKTRSIVAKYRLASPNYASIYEFSPYMNDGVDMFTVDLTYAPYAPYIRIAPMFNGLYGSDFGDCRGLVCRGDFSMPQINDSWANYINNNKNYAAIFDRNIDTLKFNRNMSAVSSGVGIAASGITSAVTQNPMGLIGIGSQLAGGIMNFASAQRAIGDTQYLHELEMENIQAQPHTISNVGTFTINNKIFPVLEIYDCTDEETDNVKEYFKRFSFNINRLGKIQDYIRRGQETWIEADLIRVEDFEGDAHELMVLKNELKKGVYL